MKKVTKAILRAKLHTHKWLFCYESYAINSTYKYKSMYRICYIYNSKLCYIDLREAELLDKSPKEIAKYIDSIVDKQIENIKKKGEQK